MLKSGGHLSFNHMGDLVLLPISVHINEYLMVNIPYFAEVANIVGVHINMDTSNEKSHQYSHQIRKKNHFKACAEDIFYINLDEQIMITNNNYVSVNTYSYLSIVKQSYDFLLILKLKERRNAKISTTHLMAGDINF